MTLFTLFYYLLINLVIDNIHSRSSADVPETVLQVPVLSPAQVQPGDQAGKSLYIKCCLTCHQADGRGVPNMYPPIQQSDWVNGDKTKLINVVLNGLSGEIEVNGEYYDQTMPKFNYLSNNQISNILSYIRQNYGNNSSPVTLNDVLMIRNVK